MKIKTTSPLPTATGGQAYTYTLSVSGGTAPYTWAINTGSLPAGLLLTGATGVISGTPTAVQTSTFAMRVTDSTGLQAVKTFHLPVNNVLSSSSTTPVQTGTFTPIDFRKLLPVVDGYVAVPDIAIDKRMFLADALATIPGSALATFIDRQFFVLPEFQTPNSYPSDYYASLRAASIVL